MFEEGKGCTPDARAAIRAAFHDCFPGTGCDGSLILAEELTWNQSRGMEFIGSVLKDKAATYGVGVADIIQFAAGKQNQNHAYSKIETKDNSPCN